MACWDRGHLCVPPGMGDSASRRAAARGIAPALHAWGGAGLGKGGTGLRPMPVQGGERCLRPPVYSPPRQHIPSSSCWDKCRKGLERAGDSVPQLPGCRGSPTAVTAPGQGLYQVQASPYKPSLCPGSAGSSPKSLCPSILNSAAHRAHPQPGGLWPQLGCSGSMQSWGRVKSGPREQTRRYAAATGTAPLPGEPKSLTKQLSRAPGTRYPPSQSKTMRFEIQKLSTEKGLSPCEPGSSNQALHRSRGPVCPHRCSATLAALFLGLERMP